MPDRFRTDLATILPTLLARVVTVTGLPTERVFVCQREEVPYDAHGDSYVFLRVEDTDFDDANIIGAGRIDARERVVVTATIRSRLALDEADRDTVWMTNASLGHLQLRHDVLDALLGFFPENSQNSWVLTTHPLTPGRGGKPRKERPKGNTEWGESLLAFNLEYELDLSQAYL